MALHVDTDTMQDTNKLIDYLVEEHASTREHFRSKIDALGQLVQEISTWKSNEVTDYFKEHFSGILDRVKKI